MKEYLGIRTGDGAASGPTQLAQAILADHFGDDERALTIYQKFKFAVVAGFQEEEWRMNSTEIDTALKRISSPGVTSSL
jgi:hypothetical protein